MLKTLITTLLPSLFALTALAALGSVATGCGDDPRVVPSASRNLAVDDDPRSIDIPLATRSLKTQADFDALEDRYLSTMGRDRLVRVYEVMAADGDPKSADIAILLQRLALLHLGASTGSERLQKVFAWADKLRLGAPDSPHSVFLLAQIKRMLLLVGSADGTFNLDARNKDIAIKLLADWDRLFKLDPSYVGPNGVTAAKLRPQREQLAAAVKALSTAPPKATATRSDARTSTEGERQARIDLWRFEHGSNGERATMCSERDERGDAGGRGSLEQWVDLRCASVQGKPEVADKLLASLGDAVSSLTRCAILQQLTTASQRWGRELSPRLMTLRSECKPTPAPQPKQQ